MKLDGEKLLADLKEHSEMLKKSMGESDSQFTITNYANKLSQVSAIIFLIKSGDYTIEDKG